MLEESLYIHNIRDMKVTENVTSLSKGQGFSQNHILKKKKIENLRNHFKLLYGRHASLMANFQLFVRRLPREYSLTIFIPTIQRSFLHSCQTPDSIKLIYARLQCTIFNS